MNEIWSENLLTISLAAIGAILLFGLAALLKRSKKFVELKSTYDRIRLTGYSMLILIIYFIVEAIVISNR